jgi:D-sedoheptulose 7-phosphate isomerase
MIEHNYIGRLQTYLEKFELKQIDFLVDLLISVESNGSRVFIAGNGGSASTASHMATDLLSLNSKSGFKLKVISLCDNTSLITAVANDNDFSQVFCEQIKILGQEGDLLIVISASGNSPNLLHALEAAEHLKMKTVGILGFDGGKIKNLVSKYLLVKSEIGDYGPVEDIHLIINHMIKERVLNRMKLGSSGPQEIKN